MKKILIVAVWLSHSFALLSGQTASQIKADKRYVWAEATASNLRRADEEALQQLMSQISYTISAEGHTAISNRQTGGRAEGGIDFNQIIKTYSMATLNNTKRLIVAETTNRKKETFVTVMRYILQEEIDHIFQSRKTKATDFTEIAHKDLERLQIGDALRYYYWAWALVQSLPHPHEVEVPDVNGKMQKADSYLPRCINEILDKLKAGVLSKEAPAVKVGFQFKGRPVSSLDFTFFDGMDWSAPTGIIDGAGLADLRPGYMPEELKIRYEYQYFGEAQADKEVQQVLDAVSGKHFPKAETHIPLKKPMLMVPEKEEAPSAKSSTGKLPSVLVRAPYKKSVAQVLKAIDLKRYDSVRNLFTAEGWTVFDRLIHYGNARIISSSREMRIDELADYVYCRAVPMQFTFNRNRQFAENVVFVFNKDKKIDNIQFGLSQVAEGDILNNPAWNATSKLVLRNFLENYKTAYALKNIDYLEQILSDDALIITGKVMVKREGDVEMGYKNNRYVQLTRQDKTSYLKRLRQVFSGQEFINIKFANNEVVKMGKGGEIYGIQIKQDYFSASYGDSGYLFVLVDVNNPNEPVIHVRAWQEAPDPEWGLIGPATF